MTSYIRPSHSAINSQPGSFSLISLPPKYRDRPFVALSYVTSNALN